MGTSEHKPNKMLVATLLSTPSREEGGGGSNPHSCFMLQKSETSTIKNKPLDLFNLLDWTGA